MGISVLEMSHRQPEFVDIAIKLEQYFRKVLKVPDDFNVYLMNGGSTLQFSAVPLNLTAHLVGTEKCAANLVNAGKWSNDAFNEAGKFCKTTRVNPIGDSYSILDLDSWTIDKDATYFYLCQNETIEGIEYDQGITKMIKEKVKSEAPDSIFVHDMTSIIFSRDLTKDNMWDDIDVIFGGNHKNLGTSGVSFLAIRKEL